MNYGILLDIKRCSGCQACVVACMDQNNLFINKKEEAWRQVYSREIGEFPEVDINYLSISCMHCEDTPCLISCPTGAITKNESGVIQVRQEFCIGCHSCSLACPFGVPRFREDGKMHKCELCRDRIQSGLEPACVHTCPSKALKLGEINMLVQQIGEQRAKSILTKIL